MTLAIGRRVLGRYVVEAVLGRGGMGEVYRARHETLDYPVAIKIITLHADGSLLTRFTREARAMALVRSPHVVAVHDLAVLDDGCPCVVMELVSGESLETRLGRERSLPVSTVLPMAVDALAGLAAVHDAGIVHRDIKPSNLLIDSQTSQIKLADFGLAYLADEGRMTRTGEVFGTPAYMAPEQATTTRVDARADLYSMALVFYECLTGTLPGDEAGLMAPVARVAQPLPWPIAPGGREPIPPHVAEALMRTLDTEPTNRPHGARELVSMLHAPSRSEPPIDGPKQIMAPISTPHPSEARSDAEAEATLLVAARIPPSMLNDPTTRRWLAALAVGGRAFTVGGLAWVYTAQVHPKEAVARVASLTSRLDDRFGREIKLQHAMIARPIALTPAMLAGGADLPSELQALIARLRE